MFEIKKEREDRRERYSIRINSNQTQIQTQTQTQLQFKQINNLLIQVLVHYQNHLIGIVP